MLGRVLNSFATRFHDETLITGSTHRLEAPRKLLFAFPNVLSAACRRAPLTRLLVLARARCPCSNRLPASCLHGRHTGVARQLLSPLLLLLLLLRLCWYLRLGHPMCHHHLCQHAGCHE